MKKIVLVIIGIMLVSSCSTPQWWVLNTSGIATYNRHTGQFEILWENSTQMPVPVHDTIYVDSCKIGK